MIAGLAWGTRYLVDAHRPAQDAADSIGLPMTVFYHPDHAYNYTNSLANVLRDRKTELHVTWLPEMYFV